LTLTANVTNVLNGTIEAVKSVIPASLHIASPSLFTEPVVQSSIGVLIGMTGDIRGRLIIEAEHSVFSGIGEMMFGMAIEGEMLESFTGELGNMIAGNLSTHVSQKDIIMDITPPTVIVGQTKMYGFDKAFRVPVQFEDKKELQIILMLEVK
jgi:chemotaxis protein CheX